MRTTLDLPDATFRQLKSLAARRGTTLKQVLRSAVEKEIVTATAKLPRRRIKVPVLKSKEPGSLNLTNAEIDDFLA
jgi:predicted DNA-binding ribbon-helix-helix protein